MIAWGPSMQTRTFDLLTPHVVQEAVESAFGLSLDGTLSAYPSYVNRVYGLVSEGGQAYVAKFYRPGRGSEESVLEEHRFVLDCAEAELPVAAPLRDLDRETLASVTAAGGEREETFDFALYPRKAGRSFDAESDQDWARLGGLVGRLHAVGERRQASHRLVCAPNASTAEFLRELEDAGVVPAKHAAEFFGLARQALSDIEPLFEGVALQRIHGDCHRGNILDRPGEGLLLIDFDDMMRGPAVQDLWLLLPDRARCSRRELELILEGYEAFHPFERSTLRLIEPLRLMRLLYYLAWSARQRGDRSFRQSNAGWGGDAFWIKEIEDLRDQLSAIEEEG
jgi:Ser/Thr protein kinase RdoA (MazF antagonist)